MKRKFDLGQVVATPGALEAMSRNKANPANYLARHAKGDWGVLGEEDKAANEASLRNGTRILSAYLLPDKTKIWIITDGEIDDQHHRYATTILLPEEY